MNLGSFISDGDTLRDDEVFFCGGGVLLILGGLSLANGFWRRGGRSWTNFVLVLNRFFLWTKFCLTFSFVWYFMRCAWEFRLETSFLFFTNRSSFVNPPLVLWARPVHTSNRLPTLFIYINRYIFFMRTYH